MKHSDFEKLRDFRNFLFVVWKHLKHVAVTPNQYEVAEWLQHGPKRIIVEAFRGIGKSWITVALCLHTWFLDPEKKILVCSASRSHADAFSGFCFQLIDTMPLLRHLKPKPGRNNSKLMFDVGPSSESMNPSCKSVGIYGQITGMRADIVVADDLETDQNCLTPVSRARLHEAVKEFDAILKPDGRIIYLGTPHTEESLYNELQQRGYVARIWPARYPTKDLITAYGDRLSPRITDGTTEATEGKTTEPSRFSDYDLDEREISHGRSGFAMQYMLDPNPSDRFLHPLRLSDLIVMDIAADVAPEKVVWASSPELGWDSTVPMVGFSGDRYYRPMQVLGEWLPYSGSVMSLDPSGRGGDETGFAIVKHLNGFLYAPEVGGMQGGYEEGPLIKLAEIAKLNSVNKIIIEENFGDGMFAQLFKPILHRVYPCAIEEVRHSKQKEMRIIDTLEPVMNRHRLIVDPMVIRKDFTSVQCYPPERRKEFQLFYQMSRLTKDRGSLAHDDRLDALAIAVAYWVKAMAADEDLEINSRKEALQDAELERFAEHVIGRPAGNRKRSAVTNRLGALTALKQGPIRARN